MKQADIDAHVKSSGNSKLAEMPGDLLSVASSSRVNNWRGFARDEVLRLLLQTLDELGYRDVVASLEDACGVELLREDVLKLKQSVLGGKWQQAGGALLRLPIEQLTRQACWFLLMQHKFLETLTNPASSLEEIIESLRKDVSTAAFDPSTTERLHECASLLMYTGSERTIHALQISSLCRSQLFTSITCLLPPSVVMQPSRLATILSHARRFQVLCCPLHVEHQSYLGESIVDPHLCKVPVLPQSCVGCFHAHQKEVWAISVAPKLPHTTETLVASGAADKSVCVWLLTTDTPTQKNTVEELLNRERTPHSSLWSRWLAAWLESDCDSRMRPEQSQPLPMVENGVVIGTCQLLWRVQRLTSATAFLDWDSTGTLLAAGGETAFIEAWEEGRRIGDYCTHSGSLVAMRWVPGSRRLISIGSDRTMRLVSLQQSGLALTHVVEYEWLLPARPQEAVLLPRGDSVAVFFSHRHAEVFNLITKKETFW